MDNKGNFCDSLSIKMNYIQKHEITNSYSTEVDRQNINLKIYNNIPRKASMSHVPYCVSL